MLQGTAACLKITKFFTNKKSRGNFEAIITWMGSTTSWVDSTGSERKRTIRDFFSGRKAETTGEAFYFKHLGGKTGIKTGVQGGERRGFCPKSAKKEVEQGSPLEGGKNYLPVFLGRCIGEKRVWQL